MSFIQQFFTSRDNNANAETFVGQEGRLWWDPITNQIYSSDGNTPGGIPLAGGGGGNGTPGGLNGQVQFNQAGNFGGTANLTINSSTGALTAVSFVGNGGALSNITGANVNGTVANATYALSANSATSLINGSSSVILNSDGTMVFPNNNINTGANPITLWSTDSSSLLWRDAAGGAPSEPVQTIIEAGNGAATITVSTGVLAVQSQKIWTFNTAGNTVFPDTTVQTTAYPGTANTLSLSGNITGNYILGNGSQLTGLPATYGNSNVATFLANFGSNVISTTGNVNSGNLNATGLSLSGNVVSAINTTANITTTANISGGNVIGTTGVSVGGTGGDLTMTGGAITGVGNITSNGIMAINAPGGITTTAGSFDIVNATATTVNIGGSASNVNIGATTGTLTINNPNIVATQSSIAVFNTTATTANIFGAASTIIMGAAGAGTLTLRNGTIVGTQATQNLFNTVATTVNFAGAATTLNIGGAGNATFSANTQVRVSNTGGSALSVAGNITGGNLTTTGAVYSNYNTNTANTGSFMATGGNTKGGTGYLDFLVAQNTSGGATNPYKWLRVNSTGGLEVINSAYTSTLMILTDAGAMSVSGSYQVNGKQAVNGPAFRAYVDAGQAITSGSQQKVTFNGETFDTNSNFASSRFTPTVEGYYQLNATVRIAGGSGTGECMLIIWKNGSEYARGTNESGTEQGANFYSMQVSDLAYANGTTDYFEIYIQQTSGSNKDTTAGQNISYFSGAMVRGA